MAHLAAGGRARHRTPPQAMGSLGSRLARSAALLQLCSIVVAHTGGPHGVMNIGVVTVPQQQVVVVERLGKFHRMLPAGLHLSFPFPIDTMRMHDLKERPYHLAKTPAITRDNVDLIMDGVVYLRITDAYRANYAIADPIEAMIILAQTTVRSKIGEMTLDQTFKNREELNSHVVNSLGAA